MDELRFGTDGWRDRIGERFTTDNVRRAAQATAAYLKTQGGQSVVVARDTRFGGAMFAQAAADTFAANGLTVHLASEPLPTPVTSFAVKHLAADAGVMLTASHNPPAWNGFKLKGPYGGTATQDVYEAVAARCAETPVESVARLDTVGDAAGNILELDVRAAYFRHLAECLDIDTLKGFDGTLVHDAMGGAAGGWMKGFADHAGLDLTVDEVRGAPDPLFYGAHPEPIPAHLGPLRTRMSAGAEGRRPDLGIATDGDGDRLGAVLPGGRPLNSHEIFVLLLDQRLRAGAKGRVVKTFTVARLIERLAQARSVEVTETPVGFKWLVDEMLAGDVLIAGEESGGIGIPQHLPERDGIFNGFLLLQALAELSNGAGAPMLGTSTGGPLASRLEEIQREVDWRHAYDRVDLALASEGAKNAVLDALKGEPSTFVGRKVDWVEARDGVKLNFEDGSWLLFRASGTEPLLRIYCEAHSTDDVKELLEAAERFALEQGGGSV